MAQLNDLLASYSLQQKELDKPCPKEDANKIALALSNWETLAPFIGLGHNDVDTIKEDCRESQSRKLTLLEKWRQKYGRDATYLKLAEGLQKIDRRDLIEEILKIVELRRPQVHWRSYVPSRRSFFLMTTSTATLILAIAVPISLYMLGFNFFTSDQFLSFGPDNHIHKNALVTHKQSYIPPSDLPEISGPFVGRQDDVESITTKLLHTSTRIINIHGPPAFGKSTLAIRIGYKLVNSGVAVRYIDTVEQKQILSLTNTFAGSDGTGLKKYFDSEWRDSNSYEYNSLFNWAQVLQNNTVLILDNCDGILNSNFEDSFIDLITKLPNNELKLIVTSQQQLVLIDHCESWPVKELDSNASKELLGHMISNISSSDAIALSDSVGGCPLALKVIGMIVNSSGDKFVPSLVKQLNQNPITTLDKASEKKKRFTVVMDTAIGYLDSDLKTTGQHVCLFPGSFDLNAALSILFPFGENHFESLVQHSLLEQYVYATERRFKMHKLIREYFRKFSTQSMYRGHFEQRFRSYYSDFFMNFTRQRSLNETTEKDEYLFNAEKYNIDHLIHLFKSLPWQEYSSVELSTLTIAISEKWIPLDVPVLEGFVQRLTIDTMEKIVCRKFPSYDACTKMYLDILDRIYAEKCAMKCYSNVDCIIKVLRDNRKCNLFLCASTEHVLLWLDKHGTNVKNLLAGVQDLYREIRSAKFVCLFTKMSVYMWKLLILLVLYEVLAYFISIKYCIGSLFLKITFFDPDYIIHIILFMLINTFITALFRFLPLSIALGLSDLFAYLNPEHFHLFIANQAVLHHLFSLPYLLSTFLVLFVLMLLVGIVSPFSSNFSPWQKWGLKVAGMFYCTLCFLYLYMEFILFVRSFIIFETYSGSSAIFIPFLVFVIAMCLFLFCCAVICIIIQGIRHVICSA